MLALRFGVVARPSSPSRAKAGLGGIPIALALFGGVAVTGTWSAMPVVVASSAALFLFGLAHDRWDFKPSAKVVVEIVIASVFLFFDLRLHWADSVILDSLLTVFWIVGITSAFNLLDNMDGLCAGIAVITGAAFLASVLPAAEGTELFLKTRYILVLIGAVAGFLIYNVHPAALALGNSGSLVIGLNMAAMTLQVAAGRGSDLLSVVAVPLIVVLIPIVDTAMVGLSRLFAAPAAGRAHSSHRLVAMGLSERVAVGLLWVLSAVSGAIGVVAGRSSGELPLVMMALFTIGMALFAVYLGRVQIHEGVESGRLPSSITPLGIELGYRRRLTEVVLDLLLVLAAYNGAFRLRYDVAADYAEHFDDFLRTFPIVLGTQMVMLFAVGAYRGMWRYFSLSDSVTFGSGVFLGVVTSQAVLLFFRPAGESSPALALIYGMLLFLLLVGSRASFRLISEFVQRQRHSGRRLVIYGADDAGSIAVRHLLHDAGSAYRIVGFIDDDFRLRHLRVHGYKVIGGYDHLVGLIMGGQIDAVALTGDPPAAAGLPWLCAKHGVSLHKLTVDWREVPVSDALVAAGSAAVPAAVEPRVLAFTDGSRDRASAPLLRPIATGEPQTAPIRVVHIITRLILGGAQENTLYTAIGQHQDPRFDVTLLCGIDEAGEGNMFAQATRAGVRTVVLPSLLREIRPLTDVKAILDVYRFLKRGGYDVVHTHSSKAGVVGRIAARMAGVPVVVHTLHGLAFHEYQSSWKNRLYVALERFCAPMSQRLISVSEKISDAALAKHVGRREQHMRIFSGIELDVFLSARDRWSVEAAKQRAGIPPGAPVVGKVARMFELKGHEQFLAAAAAIARQEPGTYFLLVGDGPLREQLREDAARLGIGDRVVMVGRVPPESVPDYIQAMDVVVHTSLREGIARVLPQAGAVGKPVVTFDLDGAPEVVRDGVSGYLVPPVDTDAIAARVVELLGDPQKRAAFGAAGREFAAAHFSVEHMVERISELYLSLLNTTSS